MNRISFMVGTLEEDNEVMILFKGFDSPEEAEAYADYLSDNLALLLDESHSGTVH
jgi:plasmid stabilization system protein ParE